MDFFNLVYYFYFNFTDLKLTKYFKCVCMIQSMYDYEYVEVVVIK